MWRARLLFVILASFLLIGCSTPLMKEITGCDHDVSQAWPHNPCDIDELVIHMDEKINRIIECEGDVQCQKDIIGI